MFSTKVDTIWPSKESCEMLEMRLKNNSFKYKYEHICFKHMSHFMLENCSKNIKWFIKSKRNYPKECRDERSAMGELCIDWIENVWTKN